MGDVYGLLLVSDPAREDNAGSNVESSTVSVLFSMVSSSNEQDRARSRRATARICRICSHLLASVGIFESIAIARLAFRQILNVADSRACVARDCLRCGATP